MKVEQNEATFSPVTLTLETKEEVFFFLNLLNFNEDKFIAFAKTQINNPDLEKLAKFKELLFPTFELFDHNIDHDLYREWEARHQII